MIIETRYMRSDQHTINKQYLNYKLLPTPTSIGEASMQVELGDYSLQWGVRVFKVSEAGVRTEITTGVSAIVERTVNGYGMQFANFLCPGTELSSKDAIKVDVYVKFGTLDWAATGGRFITTQLPPLFLHSVTWTVWYFTERWTAGGFTWATFAWGNVGLENARIENFTYTVRYRLKSILKEKGLVGELREK